MRSRAPYTECKLYYDAAHRGLEEGHYLLTPAGSAYWITAVRPDKNRPYRVHLKCLRWPKDEIPADATVHPIHWYKRAKKKRARLETL